MTYCIPDGTPENWFKASFQTRFMSKVNEYFSQTKPVVELSGAITYNSMLEQMAVNLHGEEARYTTLASFENEKDYNEFVTWYASIETENKPDDYSIVISDTLTR